MLIFVSYKFLLQKDMMEFQAELSKKDIFRLQTLSMRDGYWNYFMIVFFLFIIALWVKVFRDATFSSNDLFFPIVITLFPLLLWFLMDRRSAKMKNETAVFKHPIRYYISEESLKVEAYQSSSTLLWQDAFKYIEDKDAFYVYISSVQAYILPKRFFAEEQKAVFRSILTEKVKRRKPVFSRIFCVIFSVTFLLAVVSIFIYG